jgi:tetratricopeptide (TPR) repeat protein
MFRRCLLLPAIVFACSLFGNAAAVDPRQIYDQSTDALYNLDFITAQRGYETLTHDYPDNPDYWNALASSVWLKITFDQQKLDLESFSSYGKFGTRDSKDTVNPADEKRLRDTVTTALSKSEVILKKNPMDVRGLYAKGISNAMLASFDATVKRSYLTAHSEAKAARDLHERVVKLDPTFYDARLSIGAYDYVVGAAPWLVKVLIGVVGIHGNGKEAGIEELETAATKGTRVATDAKMVLAVVYARERRYDQAVELWTNLHMKYPRNFLFELAEGSIYGKMGKFDQAVRVYEEVLAKVQGKKDGYDRLRQAKVYFALGRTQIDGQEFEKSIESFTHVVSARDATPNEKGGAYLWLGKLYDSKKDRPKALQQYEAILSLDCDPDIKADAQKYKYRAWGT